MAPDARMSTTLVVIGGLSADADPALLAGCPGGSLVASWEQLKDLSAAGRRFLRERLRGQEVVLFLASDNATPLLNHIVLLAACFRPRRLEVFRHSDRSRLRVRWHHLVGAVWSLLTATLLAVLSLAHFVVVAHIRRLQLQREAPDAVAAPAATLAERDVLYIKTNYAFSGSEIGGATAHTLGVVNAVAGLARKTVCLTVSTLKQVEPAVRQVVVPAPASAPLLPSWYGLVLSRSLLAAPAALVSSGAMVYQRLVPFCAPGLALAGRYQGTCTLEYNGSEAWITRKWGTGGVLMSVLGYFERTAVLAADCVVVVSEVLADELRAIGVPEHRIRVHPNGVDPGLCDSSRFTAEEVAGIRTILGIAADSTVVTFVGTFGKWHGAEVFADAIEQWAREDPDGVARRRAVFVFAGDGLMLPEVKSRLSPETTSRFVRFPGMMPHESILTLLAASDIVVSPHVPNADGSRFFGSPTKLFEYMSMARAIVASDLEQIGEILIPAARVESLRDVDCETHATRDVAILCRPGSAQDIRTAMEFLADRPALRRALGRNARDLVLAKFTWEHHVKVILGTSAATGTNAVAARPPEGTDEVQG